ncbi:hypothetical protein VTL71DRAFT_15580 [Oculimacula yallundae]|uniref:2EXR domain-containing protein n=1 Tax=Oculimacula yallundae TaxID=86028 RepID=A0ABR4CIC6_9HELO
MQLNSNLDAEAPSFPSSLSNTSTELAHTTESKAEMHRETTPSSSTCQDIQPESIATTTAEDAGMACSVDSATASGSLFARFAKLPAELQLAVWKKFAVADLPARVVAVNVQLEKGFIYPPSRRDQGRTNPYTKFAEMRILKCSSRTRLPGLLHSCTTARRLAMKDYAVEIESKSHIIRLDGNKDTLFLFSSKDRAGVTEPAYDNLRILMCKQQTLSQSGDRMDFIVKGIKRLTAWDPLRMGEYSSRVRRKLDGSFHLRDAFPDLQKCVMISDSMPEETRIITYLQNTDEEVRFIKRTFWPPGQLLEHDIDLYTARVQMPLERE